MPNSRKNLALKYMWYIIYRSVDPLIVQSYTIYNEAVNPLNPRKYNVLNGNFVFHLHDDFHVHKPGVE